MNDCMRLRVVLRESAAGRIYERALETAEPYGPEYGKYATRAQMAEWANPAPAVRTAVIQLFQGLQVDEIGNSPLLIVTGARNDLAKFFQPGTLDRVDPGNSRGLHIPSWEWAALANFEHDVKSVHAVHGSVSNSGKRTQDTAFAGAPPPNGGWVFSYVKGGKQGRRLHHAHAEAPRSAPDSRLEEGATPSLIRRLYNLPDGLNGSGETIALMSLGPSSATFRAELIQDMNAFWAHLGIQRTGTVSFVQVGPASAAGGDNPLYRLEATMGPSWAGAMAPGANLVIYEVGLDVPDPWLVAIEKAVSDDQHAPTILCMTWTMPEEFYYRQFGRAAVSLALTKASALGITVIAAAGDWGVYDGRPGYSVKGKDGGKVARAAWPHATFPSTEDRVLSVGGTLVNALQPVTELAWSGPLPPDPDLARELPFISLATSGGFSQHVPIPDWQRDTVVGTWEARIYDRGHNMPAVLPYGRGYPDVALMAAGPSLERGSPPGLSATGYRLVVDGKWIDYAGGTSMAAPIWSSILAGVNQRRAAQGRPRIGFVNPPLYYLGRTRPLLGPNVVFRQIQSGNSDIDFRVLNGDGQVSRHTLAGYRAKAEWDPVTGLGVPNVAVLADALTEYPPPRPASQVTSPTQTGASA